MWQEQAPEGFGRTPKYYGVDETANAEYVMDNTSLQNEGQINPQNELIQQAFPQVMPSNNLKVPQVVQIVNKAVPLDKSINGGLASLKNALISNDANNLLYSKKVHYVQSLDYFPTDNKNVEGIQEAQEINVKQEKGIFYDPAGGVLGDPILCVGDSNPYVCVQSKICGWCAGTQKCISGSAMGPKEECTDSYTFTAFKGWNPKETQKEKQAKIAQEYSFFNQSNIDTSVTMKQ